MGKILVLNTGSSSLKFALYTREQDGLLVKGRLERLGQATTRFHVERFYGDESGIGESIEEEPAHVTDTKGAISFAFDYLLKEGLLASLQEIELVGHRVVHGAAGYDRAALITDEVKRDIKELARFAPLHNPHNLYGIERCEKLLTGVPQVAVFDTAFHQTMERKAYLYGINPHLCDVYGIRKYGFHGTNHKYCALTAAEMLGAMPRRLVTCHLGNGSSVAAIEEGISIDTSMGFTPTDGLLMGTRSGAIDPEAVLYLMRELHKSPEKIDHFLNKDSGLRSIAGTEDVRDIWARKESGDEDASLAFEMLCYRIVTYIGSYAAALNGLDCLVFSAGIGENAWYVRERVCSYLSHLGVRLDLARNRAHDGHNPVISEEESPVKVLVVRANEELQIAREAAAASR